MSDLPFPNRENDVLAHGVMDGIEWVAMRAPIGYAVNGYVKVPDGHPWYEIQERDGYLDMGVPFGECTWQAGSWFGFDTLHGGQSWPESPLKSEDDVQMTESLAVEWTLEAARNAASYINTGTYSI